MTKRELGGEWGMYTCFGCGELFDYEEDDDCPHCGEPANDAPSDEYLRKAERQQMGIS